MNEALTLNNIYSEPQTTRPEDGVFHSSTLKEDCGCNSKAIKAIEAEDYVPSVNGSFGVTSKISKELFLEKMLELVKYAKSLGLDVTNININQW